MDIQVTALNNQQPIRKWDKEIVIMWLKLKRGLIIIIIMIMSIISIVFSTGIFPEMSVAYA